MRVYRVQAPSSVVPKEDTEMIGGCVMLALRKVVFEKGCDKRECV